jgi:peptidyl-prolyl cis-trans isomerase SurA
MKNKIFTNTIQKIMTKNLFAIIITFVLTLVSFGQSNDPIVLSIDGEDFTISEFNYIYTKNNKKISYKKADLDNYMELFINYKLKVRESENLGYDTIPNLINELRQYRGQLSQPYMIDKEKNEALVKEAYDRTKYEIRASHILIRISPEATPIDTLKAYNEILAIRTRIEQGENFSAVAKGKNGSQDPSASKNGGDLGYFTALQMVYAFEDAAFNTEIGEVSMPIRTQFGFHIIKVSDKREAKGKIETAHIMILSNDQMNTDETAKAKEKINEIYELLNSGEKFEELAMKFSDDQSSKSKGGLLPAFGAGSKQRMVPVFEETAYSIENNGEYSKPFLTSYGWHIVKRISLTPIANYEEMHRELKLKVERDVRAQKTKQAFINTLKIDYTFSENKELIQDLRQILDQSIMQGKWKKIESFEKSNEALFSFANQKITLNDFAQYLLVTQRREKPQSMETYLVKKYELFVNSEITKYEDSQLETKYPAFKTLMQEYQDGILIFEIMQKQIWNKASKDSTGLSNYYNNHKGDFMYPIRYKGTLYTCSDKTIAKEVVSLLKSDNLTYSEINDSINKNSALNLKTKNAIFNSLTTAEFKEGKKQTIRSFSKGTNKGFKYNGTVCIFEVEEIMQPTQRKFDEAKGLVTAAYQNELQTKWIAELRTKSKIIINESVLYSAKKYE